MLVDAANRSVRGTGAHQTCHLIVLDQAINSMTEFKQIIGRGTRVREDFDKRFFTIMDFRNATRLFYDPDFDGEPVQAVDYEPGEPLILKEPPDEPYAAEPIPEAGEHSGEEAENGRVKYRVEGFPVQVLTEHVTYVGKDGQPVTESFEAFSGENVRKVYRSLAEFLQRWNSAERKEAILAELVEQGLYLSALRQLEDEIYRRA